MQKLPCKPREEKLSCPICWVPDVGRRLVDRLLDSGDEKMRMMGAWHIFRRSFQNPAYVPIADALIEEGVVYRRLRRTSHRKRLFMKNSVKGQNGNSSGFFNEEKLSPLSVNSASSATPR